MLTEHLLSVAHPRKFIVTSRSIDNGELPRGSASWRGNCKQKGANLFPGDIEPRGDDSGIPVRRSSMNYWAKW